jgi:hypothetical protein
MSTAVNQLHISFVPAQDRLLLRVATVKQQEVRLWMTRRFVKLLWPELRAALQTDPSVAGQTDPGVREEVLSFRHEQAVQDTKFTKTYQAAPETRPLTQVPLLLSGVRREAVDPEHTRLELITARGRSFQLTLDRKTIHSLCKLIADCATKAQWDLELPLAQSRDSGDPPRRTIN